MRVLVVAAWPPWPLTEGDRLVMHHQLTHLAAQHEITVLAAGRWSDPPAPEEAASWPYLHGFSYVAARPRNPVTYLALRARSAATREPREVGEVETRGLRTRLLKLLGDDPPDLVHLFGWGTAQLARLVPPHIGVVHSPIDAWGLGHGNRARNPLRRLLEADQPRWVARHERRHYPRCDAVVVVSRHDATYLDHQVPGIRTWVIPNGVSAGPTPQRRVERGLIGLHGNFGTSANIDAARQLVHEILPRVRAQVPEAHAVVIGRNAPPAVSSMAGHHVSVTGEVADIRAELDRLDVYVAPMVSGTGIKNKVLEAMAAGLPVVTTTAAADAIPCGGALMTADDPDTMAQSVIRLLRDRDANKAQGLLARDAVVTALSWPDIAQRLDEVWREVAASARAPH